MLGVHCDIISGGTPDTENSKFWDNGSVNWFTPSEVGKNKYVYSSVRKITTDGLRKSNAKLLPAGSILLSSRATIGDCSIAMEETTTNQGFQSVVNSNKYFDNNFLYYYIQTKKKDFIKRSNGSTFLEISNNEIKKTVISYPSFDIQMKIGSLLDKIDNKIYTQKKIIENYKSLINKINNLHFENVKTRIQFNEVYTKAKEGGTPSTKKNEYYSDGDIPFIKIDDLSSKYITTNKSFINRKGLDNSSAWIVPENSLLYSNGATIGEVSITTYPVSTKQGILGIIPQDNISTEYLYYLMKSRLFRKEIYKITTKGTMDAAYIKDIDSIKCPIEDNISQDEYVEKINKIHILIENEKKILSLYEKQKQYLLNKMFI